MASNATTSSVVSVNAILEETLGLLGTVSHDRGRLNHLLTSHFSNDENGKNFRSLCCFGRPGVDVSLEVFNRLCILPKTKWGIQLSNSGVSVAVSTLKKAETTAYTTNFADTVSAIMHDVYKDVIMAHPKKVTILKHIPPTLGVPFVWFKAIIGPEYKDRPFPIPALSILRDRMAQCIDQALQLKLNNPTSRFYCAESGAYWQEANELFDAKQFYLECCSKFPAYLQELLVEKKTTLDKLAGLKVPSIRHYGVEAMVEEAYARSTQEGMENQDLPLPDGTLGGTVFAMHNGLLSAQWVASYLVDTDNNFFMEDVRAKAMNDKERMLRVFSVDHTHDKPTWMQFGEATNVYLYLSQRASTAEEGWLLISNYVVNLLITFINKNLDLDNKGKEFKLESVEDYNVGVASVANPSFGLFSLHSDAKPGIVDSAVAMYSKFMLMVPTLAIQNNCAPSCEISWVGKNDKSEKKLAHFTHDFVITHWQLMNVNEMFKHQVSTNGRKISYWSTFSILASE